MKPTSPAEFRVSLILRILPACLLVLLPTTHAGPKRWNLTAPLDALRTNFVPPAELVGAFTLDATLTLERLDGTAASVWFGDQLNFGFDSLSGHLFVEGPAVGKTKSLAPAADFIRPAKPFRFQAALSEGSELVVRIDGREVHRTRALRNPVGTLTFRPHRNTLGIRDAVLTGEFRLPEPGLGVSRTVIPHLIDGTPRPVLDFTLVIDRPRVLRGVRVDPGSGGDALSRPALDLPGRWQASPADRSREIRFRGEAELAPGIHRFSLLAALEPGTSLLARPVPRCLEVTFADGGTLRPHPVALPPLRPAYPIHKHGQFGCHTFRIPAIARAVDGSLLAVYDMRYRSSADLQGHMDIGLSRSTDGGQSWANPVPIMDMGKFGGKPEAENGCSDPNILVDPKTGEIMVTAVWTHGKPGTHQWRGKGSEPGHDIHRSSQFMMVRSRDHGLSWSAPENLTKPLKDPSWHLFAPAPGNGIALRDGTLVVPTQGRDAAGACFSNLIWSRDHGKSWTVSSRARSNTTECAVAGLSDGSLLLNMRDNRNRTDKSATNGRAMALTRDLGKSWTVHPADRGALPEPVCMASMISHTLPGGRHILIFSNPRNKNARRDMTLQLSFDDGRTWPAKHHLLLDAKGGSYSSLVMIDDHTLGILYESSQADLVFQKILLSELLQGHAR